MPRRREREPVQQAPIDVIVPPEFVVGPLAEVWGAGPGDLGGAYMCHGPARMTWERDARLDTALACAIAPVFGPWALASPGGAERLARLGITPDDLPALRAAARDRTTDPSRRTS